MIEKYKLSIIFVLFMFKKKSAILFILIANIILLAHTVVSHHHHKSEVCVESTHCDEEIDQHADAHPESKHQHDENNNLEFCSLQLTFVTPSNNTKIQVTQIDITKLQSVYQAILLYNTFSNATSITHQHYIPKHISIYTSVIATSAGLRAPPIV